MTHEISFNPTMVRLLQIMSVTVISLLAEFQSHNGAIAAFLIHNVVQAVLSFQSHNGAIAAENKCNAST